MTATCPYCKNKHTELYYSAKLPFYVWPLSRGEKNFIVPVKIFLCHNCWYAFNHKPLPEEFIKNYYDNYDYVFSSVGINYSQRSEFINMVKANARRKDHIIEIGSSNEYLLIKLYNYGYRSLGKIEPHPRIDGKLPIRAVNKDFSLDTNFESEIDIFLFDHMFEHLEKPWEFLKVISDKLSKDGKILMEFPGYCSCMHHQHVSFFTLPFLQTISDEIGLTMNVPFHNSSTVTRVIFQKVACHKKLPSLSSDELEEDKKEILLNTGNVRQDYIDKKSKLNDFLKNALGEKIYWWDTGMNSAILFNYAEPNFKKNLSFKFIDSEESREGKIFFPAGATVLSAEKNLKGRNIKYLVLASQFKDEMMQKLQEWDCNAEKIFHN
ncbi:MAG: class I SAM-dependent methyltransferase [Synergistaceae bacterium]|nr:class I SAM-dependent methyltransferase [Synergistaceae bacterium]